MKTCQICLKPIEKCRKADKHLITPYDTRNNDRVDVTIYRPQKALSYILGAYKLGRYYWLGTHISYRLYEDSILSLPLCVYEGRYTLLQMTTKTVVQINVNKLPIPRKWHDLLLILFFPQINEYVSSLPQAD